MVWVNPCLDHRPELLAEERRICSVSSGRVSRVVFCFFGEDFVYLQYKLLPGK